ncbi:MAG: DNA polymerase IV [Candidatus Thermoplasmatota archaeon]|nr:DNA polymerase IV [Candidatus Thermoplasmatota archaeon]
MARIVMHVDMDTFYVSAERLRDAALLEKSVIIGADPKEGKGRGVVAACSYEAREMGVHSGIPISAAYRRCPEAIYLRPDFPYYGRISGEVMRILEGFSRAFEQVSIDEAFLDVSSQVDDFLEAEELARRIKEEVGRRTGLTCSVGVAPNKSIAKIASDMDKPDGLTVVKPEEVSSFLNPLPVSKIPGVGKKSRALLGEMGIITIGDLASRSPGDLTRTFGKGAVWLWAVARGVEELPVEERGEAKSFSTEHTFEKNVDDWDVVLDSLVALVDDVYWRIRDDGYLFKTVGIKMRFEDFETHTRDRTLSVYSNDKKTIEGVARELFREFHQYPKKVRLIGVRVSSLKRMEPGQETLRKWTS